MNKRTLIKRFAALLANPIISPLFAWASGKKLTNWAGNIEYGTESLYPAASLQQVQDFVKKRSKLKVLGTRHCFNNIADSTHDFLSLKSMDEVVALDSERAPSLSMLASPMADSLPIFTARVLRSITSRRCPIFR